MLARRWAVTAMKQRPVVSREYKIMLRPTRFAGGEKQLLRASTAAWRAVARSLAPGVLAADGGLETIRTRRLIMFLDTSTLHLKESGYLFRRRQSMDTGECEVTLKFRHPDRYVAQSSRIRTSKRRESQTKLE